MLACKLKSQITSLRYNHTNLERSHDSFVAGFGYTVRWRWPSIFEGTSHLLGKLSSLSIDGMQRVIHCDLSSLPPSLTKLALTNITLIATSTQLLQFNLPGLIHLRVERVLANVSITARSVVVSQEDWLPNSIRNSPSIRVFRFSSSRFNRYHVACYQRDCIQAMPLLEKLTIPYSDHITTNWPVGLHTLHICQNDDDVLLGMEIPASISTLIVQTYIPVHVLQSIIQSAPPSLTCLEADVLTGIDHKLLKEMSRFTQLQSLHVPRNSQEVFEAERLNLSVLPKSITALSEVFAGLPSTWQHITENQIQLRHRKLIMPNIEDYILEICSYNDYHDNQYARYLPCDLTKIDLFNSVVPSPNNRLQSIDMTFEDSNLIETTSKLECSKLLINMTPHLTSLTVSIDGSLKLFWIDDAARFPNLKLLDLVVKSTEEGVIPVMDVHDWLVRTPPSVTRLGLDLQLSYSGRYLMSVDSSKMTLSLDDIRLPPLLQHLTLRLEDYSLSLPSVLPPALETILFDFYDVKLPEPVQDIVWWPDTLTSIHILAAHHNKPKVRALLMLPMQALQLRLSTSRLHAFLGKVGIIVPKKVFSPPRIGNLSS